VGSTGREDSPRTTKNREETKGRCVCSNREEMELSEVGDSPSFEDFVSSQFETCWGCANDIGNQLGHMEIGGCLYEGSLDDRYDDLDEGEESSSSLSLFGEGSADDEGGFIVVTSSAPSRGTRDKKRSHPSPPSSSSGDEVEIEFIDLAKVVVVDDEPKRKTRRTLFRSSFSEEGEVEIEYIDLTVAYPHLLEEGGQGRERQIIDLTLEAEAVEEDSSSGGDIEIDFMRMPDEM